jgi:hypothetical protein
MGDHQKCNLFGVYHLGYEQCNKFIGQWGHNSDKRWVLFNGQAEPDAKQGHYHSGGGEELDYYNCRLRLGLDRIYRVECSSFSPICYDHPDQLNPFH